MKLENQVVSLELSKKFKKLGLNQESLFYWGVPKSGNIPEGQLNEGLPIKNSKMYKFRDYYSAFTVAELGEMLPNGKYSWKSGHGWLASEIFPADLQERHFKTEADARAVMLIYLIESNGHQSVPHPTNKNLENKRSLL